MEITILLRLKWRMIGWIGFQARSLPAVYTLDEWREAANGRAPVGRRSMNKKGQGGLGKS